MCSTKVVFYSEHEENLDNLYKTFTDRKIFPQARSIDRKKYGNSYLFSATVNRDDLKNLPEGWKETGK